jgi:hypothetical protein
MTLCSRHGDWASRRASIASALVAAVAATVLLGSAPASADPTQSTGANAVDASGNGTQGIIGLNQDAGDSNNQGNVVVMAVTPADNSAALAKVIVDAEQAGTVSASAPTVQTNAISGSFNNSAGIVQVNQTTGQANVQLNVIALAFAANAEFSPALTDVELKGVSGPVSNGGTSSAAPGSANSLNDSFNNFRGVAQVQQIAGDSNVIVNVVAVAIGGAGG